MRIKSEKLEFVQLLASAIELMRANKVVEAQHFFRTQVSCCASKLAQLKDSSVQNLYYDTEFLVFEHPGTTLFDVDSQLFNLRRRYH